jgi:hypothetical protein
MAAASTANMDMDLLGSLHEEHLAAVEQAPEGSPCKRRGVGQEDGVSLTTLREILADQTKTLLTHQANSQQELKQDLKREMLAMQGELKKEIRQDVKREVTQGQEAIKKDIRDDLLREIESLSRTCTSQFQDLQQGVQSSERNFAEMRAAQGNMEDRLRALEARGSDSATVASAPAPGKKRALVLGGWDPDTAAEDMLEAAKNLARELRLDLDLNEIFVPGVRRGFAIRPSGGGE